VLMRSMEVPSGKNVRKSERPMMIWLAGALWTPMAVRTKPSTIHDTRETRHQQDERRRERKPASSGLTSWMATLTSPGLPAPSRPMLSRQGSGFGAAGWWRKSRPGW